MAGRQNKVGLDYFELDCHMDEKIELIEAEFGLKGFAIIVKLYQSIYSGFGYYCEWTPDISLLWARRLGVSHGGDFKGLGKALEEGSLSGSRGKLGNVLEKGPLPGFPDNLINSVVAASIRRDIFSKELFEKYRILTSSGIQKRYLNAVSKREKVEVKKEYLLFSIPQNQKNVVVNSISSVVNSISSARNEQSKEKKSKEEKSREKNTKDVRWYYPEDEQLNRAFVDFVDMRKTIKKPMTERAITLAMNKLKKLAEVPFSDSMDNDLAIQILEQSTLNCWQDLYPIKNSSNKKPNVDWDNV